MPQIKVIFFNMGGTLLQLKDTTIPQIYSKHLSNLLGRKVNPSQVYSAFRKAENWALSRKSYYYLFSDLDQRKYQNAFYNELGIKGRSQINKVETDLAELVDLEFQLESGVQLLLSKLSRDYSIGLISNWDMDLYEILESFGIKKFFDSITISGEFGISKPSLEIFKSGLADFPTVKAKNTVYIGDDYDLDILPAQKLRMFTILYDKGPSGMHGWPKRQEIKCPRVESLSEIPALLKKFEKLK
ncbi:MAG: HAD family hydrolase [Candidatus Hodarchaeales archaeon]|jgi:FMN phosphatase YigB (HAD superfamily)